MIPIPFFSHWRANRSAVLFSLLAACATGQHASAATDCERQASDACYQRYQPAGAGGQLDFYASRTAAQDGAAPTRALIVVHGHPRDADKTFNAALAALHGAGEEALHDTLVVAPVFQVADDSKCHTDGVPAAESGDLLWTCASWMEGGPASNGSGLTSFAALDALVAQLQQRWPSLRVVTVAGFSAGAQMVQHYIGFAHPPAGHRLALRYVVADPGTWLYFDPARPAPACPGANQWKYGTDNLPATLGRDAAAARAYYTAANVHYLEGERDQGSGPGTYHKILDKSCAAMAQGPDRLQRGLAYAAYDRQLLAPAKQRQVTLVPGCAHDVACVFPSAAARSALLGRAED